MLFRSTPPSPLVSVPFSNYPYTIAAMRPGTTPLPPRSPVQSIFSGKGGEQRLRGTEEQDLSKAKEKLKEKEEILSSSFAFSSLWLYSNTGLVVLGVVVG